ncbi:hypothetical protein BJ742DRAFT_716305 [Cladochytrium replicatum]|nr:hypothetical protein BJ742DRAFT_716305 [Cladochytrium replicatum]
MDAKELNTTEGANKFRFRSFADRVQSIKINVHIRISKHDDNEDEDSYFHNALVKWRDLNCTITFKNFVREVNPFAKSLPLILFHKAGIVEALIRTLNEGEQLAREPLLDLVTCLAHDLQEEFYEYFTRVYICITSLLPGASVQDVECIFNALSYLFKWLSRNLVVDIMPTFRLLLPLISEKKQFIRLFSAEAFAFLLRKVKLGSTGSSEIYDMIIRSLDEEAMEDKAADNRIDGVALIFAETIRSTKNHLHSKTNAMLLAIIRAITSQSSTSDRRFTMFHKLLVLIGTHADAEHMKEAWDALLSETLVVLTSKSNARIEHLLRAIEIWVSMRKGSRITDKRAVVGALETIGQSFHQHSVDQALWISYVRACAAMFLAFQSSGGAVLGEKLLTLIFKIDDIDVVFLFCEILREHNWDGFSSVIFSNMTRFLTDHWDTHTESSLHFLSSILGTDFHSNILRLPRSHRSQSSTALILPQSITSTLQTFVSAFPTDETLPIFVSTVNCLGYLSDSQDILFRTFTMHIKRIRKAELVGRESYMRGCVVAHVLDAIVKRAKLDCDNSLETLWESVVELIDAERRHPKVLDVAAGYFEALISFSSEPRGARFSKDGFSRMLELLRDNVGDFEPAIRTNSLRILVLFEQEPLATSQTNTLLSHCLEIDQIQFSPQTIREKLIILRKIDSLVASRSLPSVFVDLSARYFISLLGANFNAIWAPVIQSLASLSRTYENMLWTVFYDAFASVQSKVASQVHYNIEVEAAERESSPEKHEKQQKLMKNTKSKDSCVSAFELVVEKVTRRLRSPLKSAEEKFLQDTHVSRQRIDVANVQVLLIRTLSSSPHLIESRAQQIIPPFLALLERPNYENEGETSSNSTITFIARRRATHEYLTALSNLNKPASLPHQSGIRRGLLSLVATPDTQTQRLALTALLSWKDGLIPVHFVDHLKSLADDSTFRDALSTLDLDDLRGRVMKPQEWTAVMDVVTRILYGKMVSRRGRRSGARTGVEARRKAIFAFLRGAGDAERDQFVGLMLAPFETLLQQRDGTAPAAGTFIINVKEDESSLPSTSQQLGFLNTLEDLVCQLKTFALPYLPQFMKILLNQIFSSEKRLQLAKLTSAGGELIDLDSNDVDGEGEKAEEHDTELDEHDEEEEVAETSSNRQGGSLVHFRRIRQLGIRRLTQIFELDFTGFDFAPYVPALYETLLPSSRVSKLDSESAQSPSSLTLLLEVWTRYARYVPYLVRPEAPELMAKVFSILSVNGVREPVVSLVFTMCENLLSIVEQAAEIMDVDGDDAVVQTARFIRTSIFQVQIRVLLRNLNAVLSRKFQDTAGVSQIHRNETIVRAIKILAGISSYVTDDPEQASLLSDMLMPLLKRPATVVPEPLKCEILGVLENFFPILPELNDPMHPVQQTQHCLVISQLFGSLQSRDARTKLMGVFSALASRDPSMARVTNVLADFNSFSVQRLDEPDFNRRFDAFQTLRDYLYESMNPYEWRPVLHNLVFFMHDREEYAVRTNAAFGLQKLLERSAIENPDEALGIVKGEKAPGELSFMDLVLFTLLPAIKKGLRSTSPEVRGEFVATMGEMVRVFPEHPQLHDMTSLLADGDDEANFFKNVQHIQIHRRVRAYKRLSEELKSVSNGEHTISSQNLAHIFLPMVVHPIMQPANGKDTDQSLVDEAITTIGNISKYLQWGQYYALLKNFLGTIPKKPVLEKQLIRAVVSVVENFSFRVEIGNTIACADDVNESDTKGPSAPVAEIGENVHTDAENDDEGLDAVDPLATTQQEQSEREKAVKIHDIVVNKLLPELHTYLSKKDSDQIVTVRVPVAVAITRLLLRLPEASRSIQLPKLVTTLSHLLQNKLQSARDAVRETLTRIVGLLGPKYFPFIISELRGALTRGYMLHVLGYTVHAILLAISATDLEVGQIDGAVEDLVQIFVDDIFGDTSQEREAEEMTTRFRENKSTKSFDSFEILTKLTSFKMVALMLIPLKELMLGTNNVKVTRKIEQVLRSIVNGIVANRSVDSVELLTFVHELMTESLPLAALADESSSKKMVKESEQRHLVQMKRDLSEPMKYYQANAHLFVEFGMNLLQSALKKERFSLSDPQQQQMVNALVDPLAKSLYSKHSSVSVPATRILAMVARAPLPALEKVMPVIVKRLFQLIGHSSSTTTPLVQAAFKLISTLIRDVKYVEINTTQLAALIELIKPDLEEPERQGTTFSLVRALLSRQLVSNEMYELMDKLKEIMITSQIAQVRQHAREAFLQFLLEYPQGPLRVRKQVQYLLKNLSYEFESGRQSVMEMIHLLIQKFDDTVLKEFSEVLFLGLTMSLVNDESSKCREMSGVLIKQLLKRLDSNQTDRVYIMLKKWYSQEDNSEMLRTAAQVSGLALETVDSATATKWIPDLVKLLGDAIATLTSEWLLSMDDVEKGDAMVDSIDGWENIYFCLNSFGKVMGLDPWVCISSQSIWANIEQLFRHPHQWVSATSSRLFGTLLSNVDPQSLTYTGALRPLHDVDEDDRDQKQRRVRKKLNQSGSKNGVDPSAILPQFEDPMKFVQLSQAMCSHLNSSLITSELATQLVKNLFFLGKCLHFHPPTSAVEVEQAADGESEEDDNSDDEKDRENNDDEDETKSADATKRKSRTPRKTGLAWLVHKLSFVARVEANKRLQSVQTAVIRRTAVFQWYAAISTFLPPEALLPYVEPMVRTLYRTVNDETARGMDDVKTLGQDVMNLIKKQVGVDKYLAVYNSVHLAVKIVRRERKLKRTIMAVTDPERRAKRKIQKNEMKKAGRQRTVDEHRKRKVKMNIGIRARSSKND